MRKDKKPGSLADASTGRQGLGIGGDANRGVHAAMAGHQMGGAAYDTRIQCYQMVRIGLSRIWQDLAGLGRIGQDLTVLGRIWQDWSGLCRIWQD